MSENILLSLWENRQLQEPMAVFAFLSFTVAFIYFAASLKATKGFFHFFPPVIWCYFLPMFASTFGFLPDYSPVYSWMTRYLLPLALILLLLSADIRGILRLGPKALIVMLFGTLGVFIGGIVSYLVFRNYLFMDAGGMDGTMAILQSEAWKGVGALSGSWIGGTANMTAIAAGVGLDEASGVLAPFLVVDVVVAYGWMGIVIFIAQFQDKFNRFFKVDTSAIDQLNQRIEEETKRAPRRLTISDMAIVVGFGLTLAVLCNRSGIVFHGWFSSFWQTIFGVPTPESGFFMQFVQNFGSVFGAITWSIIFATVIGLIFSFTPVRNYEDIGASNIGYFVLFLVLTGYGARADLSQMQGMIYFLMMGILWIAVHIIMLLIGVFVTRSPLFFFAVGSQSNIGGPTTASIVAGVYQKNLATVGVLLGVFGTIIGTPIGLLLASIVKILAPGG